MAFMGSCCTVGILVISWIFAGVKDEIMYSVYIVRCSDETLYTGITTDVERRMNEHNGDQDGGARYTAQRRPVTFVYHECFSDRSSASKEEHRIKKLTRAGKEKLIQHGNLTKE